MFKLAEQGSEKVGGLRKGSSINCFLSTLRLAISKLAEQGSDKVGEVA